MYNGVDRHTWRRVPVVYRGIAFYHAALWMSFILSQMFELNRMEDVLVCARLSEILVRLHG